MKMIVMLQHNQKKCIRFFFRNETITVTTKQSELNATRNTSISHHKNNNMKNIIRL